MPNDKICDLGNVYAITILHVNLNLSDFVLLDEQNPELNSIETSKRKIFKLKNWCIINHTELSNIHSFKFKIRLSNARISKTNR